MSEQTVRYSPEKLQEFKQIVDEKLTTTREELDSIKERQKDQKEHVANTNVDFNENSKHFQQQAKTKEHIRRLENNVAELEAAIDRIEDGTYGVSEQTGELIREERLRAMPTARFDIK